MKGYLIDAQAQTIHLVEVGSVESANHLFGPNCTGIVERLRFRNGDAVFFDNCGLYKEYPEGPRPDNMGLITSDMFWTDVIPFFGRALVLGCSKDSVNCNYSSNCDVRSTEDKIAFWTKFFTHDEGFHWLDYNYRIDM
jgi:hypothetical protein